MIPVDPVLARPELRAACVHEYAHLVVAQALGARGFVTVARVACPEPGASVWHGRFQLFGELTEEEWRIVALAGTIAERIDAGVPCDTPSLLDALRRPGTLSDSDTRLACGYDAADVARCLRLVTLCWREIQAEAAERAACIEADYAARFAGSG